MGEIVGFLAVGLVIGVCLGWLWAKNRLSAQWQSSNDATLQRFNQLNEQYIQVKASASAELQSASRIEGQLREEREQVKRELATTGQDLTRVNRDLALAEAGNKGLAEKLDTQKQLIDQLQQKFAKDFELIANQVLETKSQRFTQINKENIEAILNPLGKNIDEFKEQVRKTYQDEAKERFSLGEKVKELGELNKQLGEEARNLTRALKGETKTQGRWGEVVLERILEKSGLRKGEEYFMEYQLFDAAGTPLRSEARGSKMRPDAVIIYPDDRQVIIDAKVSLNAFLRYVDSTDPEEQKTELRSHVQAVKGHIVDLGARAYDDYDKSLDFVMMFIPSEAAFVASLQGEPDLWDFAYDRRILLISPTNLITALKLIVDLWKREYQNKNAQAIAERGSKLYDKFCGFVKNIQDIGGSLDAAQGKYQDALGQLTGGRGNLIWQATKLKQLGVKTTKGIALPPAPDSAEEDGEE